ncbi:hypothetical protein CYY_009929 [Polysphondylium violaceum]|uniref:EF-hand domain-containing protein n=1 Tax=Polysphondylium violaceum TaxID=133409 RepID=A0A8J4PKV3_9MYCE|nr:hypothetical protein CYY_009929 [Polysphondylium violaceum]
MFARSSSSISKVVRTLNSSNNTTQRIGFRYYSNNTNSNNNNNNYQYNNQQSNNNNYNNNDKRFYSKIGLTTIAAIGLLTPTIVSLDNQQTWREKIINNYQNRIREYSTPEKIFQCFASVKKGGQYYMTAEDFIRAILPHQFKSASETGTKSKSLNLDKNKLPLSFQIADVDGDGLISYSEFMFFSTLLSIPENSVAIAFKIMDVNHDNSIDANEFMSIIRILSTQSEFSKTATATTPNTPISSQGFISHLFGADGKKKLSLEQFQNFLSQLRKDVLNLEFKFYDPQNTGYISQRDFGLLLVSYSKLGKLESHINAINSLPNTVDDKNKGISFEQFASFNKLLDKLEDVELSMDLYKGINQPFSKKQFRYVSKIVCDVNPQPEVVDTVYKIFDTDQNGDLAKDEFVSIMERRKYRGFSNQRDTGIVDKFKRIYKILLGQA